MSLRKVLPKPFLAVYSVLDEPNVPQRLALRI